MIFSIVINPNNVLMNIANGTIVAPIVNCDESGKCCNKNMTRKCYFELSLSRKDKVKSLAATNNTVKLHGNEVVVNPNLLFNRISCVLNRSTELGLYLEYELCPDPPSLFEGGQMRKTDKS